MATIQPVPDINPALPDFPGPNIPESQYDDQAYEWGTAIPGYGQRIKAVADNAHNNAQAAAGILVLVNDAQRLTELARDTAMGVANFKGDWNTLSGAMARPATVQHNSSVWLLMRDVANVAAEQPGISTAWVNQTARVASVMGRTGDVVGLTETASPILGASAMSTAPLGQWATFVSAGAAGADWPTNAANMLWNVFTHGLVNHRTQRATQIYAGAQQGWTFERQFHDGAWSAWSRVFTSSSLIEAVSDVRGVAGSIALDPRAGTVNYRYVVGNINITLPKAIPGAQLVLILLPDGPHSLAFSSNVKPPTGGIPSLVVGQFITMTLIVPVGDGTDLWHLHVGSRHAL